MNAGRSAPTATDPESADASIRHCASLDLLIQPTPCIPQPRCSWPNRRREYYVTRFVVHIGPHKTGSTYIQETLAALRGTLLERGICVPSIWNAAPGLPSHMQLVWALRNGDLTLIRRQLQEILAQRPRYVVISCEALSRLDQEQIIQLRQLLGSAPLQVVYHVRRWPERLPSLWQEEVKFGHTTMFPEYLAKHLTKYADSELRDAAMIDRFADVFGTAQIKVVSYSHLVDQKLDIARHFLATFLDLSDIVLPADRRPNRSLQSPDIELIRALNSIHARRGGKRSPAVRSWFLHKEPLVPNSLRDAMLDSQDKIRLDEATPPFALAFQDFLTRYEASIVPPRHTDGLHQLRAVDVSYVRQDYLLEAMMPKILDDIYDIYRRTA